MIRRMGLEPVMIGSNPIDIVGEASLVSKLIQKGHHRWSEIQEGPYALARVGKIEGAFELGKRCRGHRGFTDRTILGVQPAE